MVKKDGSRAKYDRSKILSGVLKACEKRPVSMEEIERTVNELEMQLLDSGEKEILSTVIGQSVMDKLKKLDEVAYVRFASVYRDFRDINEFMAELNEMLMLRKRDM